MGLTCKGIPSTKNARLRRTDRAKQVDKIMITSVAGNGNSLHANELCSRFDGVRSTGDGQWEARCPVHEDRQASLSIGIGDDGRLLLNCHAGCSTANVLDSVGLTMADLFPASNRNGHHRNGHAGRNGHHHGNGSNIVAAYDYHDERGELLFQVCRMEPKDFRQRRPDGNGDWTWSTKGVRRVLYRLPELLKADPSQIVFIVEGEKDANRLWSMGIVATCNAGGAGKWRREYVDCLEGRLVAIIADNDTPGMKHAKTVARSLHGTAASVKLTELPGIGKRKGFDVSDWLGADGMASDLLTLAEESDEWEPSEAEPTDGESEGDDGPKPILPVHFGEIKSQNPTMRKPVIDGLVREGETVGVIAPTKAGKSWTSYSLALSIVSGICWLNPFQCQPGRVLLIDNELHPETIAHRIPIVADAMGIPFDDFRERYDVISLRGRLIDYFGLGLRTVDHIEPGRYKAVIVDAHYRMLPPGVSENDNAAMAQVYNQIDRYADQTKAAWFLIHHSSKGNQAGKEVTDVGSGAGSQSRAVDSHLVLRPHEEPGHIVLDAAVRSWPPVDPITLEWRFPLWLPCELDPDKLKGRLAKNEERQNNRDRDGMRIIVDIMRKWDRDADGPATANAVTEVGPFGRDKTRNLLGKMIHSGHLTRKPVTVRNNQTHEYLLPDDDEN